MCNNKLDISGKMGSFNLTVNKNENLGCPVTIQATIRGCTDTIRSAPLLYKFIHFDLANLKTRAAQNFLNVRQKNQSDADLNLNYSFCQ